MTRILVTYRTTDHERGAPTDGPVKKRILVVDDEVAILKILDVKLRLAGYDVVTARDGMEALDIIQTAKPDVILLDIIMPGMDGFQVLERMMALAPLPVIALSARPDNSERAMALGARAFVSKPFDVDRLLVEIHRCLSGSPS